MGWDPNPNDVKLEHFEEAIRLADLSESEECKISPKVGAVVVKDGSVLVSAHRHMIGNGDHAEYVALEGRNVDRVEFVGADLITTLEPCTEKRHGKGKKPCVEWIKLRRIRKVWIGVLDENPDIRGKAISILREAGIHVQFFPDRLIPLIEKQNKEFFDYIKSKESTISKEQKVTRWNELKQLLNEFILIFRDDVRRSSSTYTHNGRSEIINNLSKLKNNVYGMDYLSFKDWNEIGVELLTLVTEWRYQSIRSPYNIPMLAFRTAQEIAPKNMYAAMGRASIFIKMGEQNKASAQLALAKEILVKEGKTGSSHEALRLFGVYLELASQMSSGLPHEGIIEVLWRGLEVVDAELVRDFLTSNCLIMIADAIGRSYYDPVSSEVFIGVSRKLSEVREHGLAKKLEERAEASSK